MSELEANFKSENLWDRPSLESNNAQQLWENALAYFKWNQENPIEFKRTVMSGKEAGSKVLIEAPRMLTVKGLCLFCGVMEEYLKDLWSSRDRSNEFYIVATRILYHIHTQNMEFAAIDVFNAGLVTRLHKLEDDEVPTGGITINHVRNLPPLANSEIEVLEKLDAETKLFPKAEK